MFGMRLTSSSAVRRPPVLFEMVPPVATRRTRGRSGAGAWVVAAVACAKADRSASASVKRRAAACLARIAPLYLRRRPGVIQREPAAQLLDGFVGRMPIERHHRARSTGCAGDLGPEPVAVDRRDFDAVLTAIDRFFEALDGHGRLHSSVVAGRRKR